MAVPWISDAKVLRVGSQIGVRETRPQPLHPPQVECLVPTVLRDGSAPAPTLDPPMDPPLPSLLDPPWILCRSSLWFSLTQAQVSLRNLRSFAEFPMRMQSRVARVGRYERHEAKRVLVRQGHPAEAFYFILSGSGARRPGGKGISPNRVRVL